MNSVSLELVLEPTLENIDEETGRRDGAVDSAREQRERSFESRAPYETIGRRSYAEITISRIVTQPPDLKSASLKWLTVNAWTVFGRTRLIAVLLH
jgi:hypothetical protein